MSLLREVRDELRHRIDWWAVLFVAGFYVTALAENWLAAVMWFVGFLSGFTSMALACSRNHESAGDE